MVGLTRSEATSWVFVVVLLLLAACVISITVRGRQRRLPIVYVCVVHDHTEKVVCRA